MNRLFTLSFIGLAGLLAGCGSSVSSSNQPGTNDIYSVAMSADRITLNSGDWSSITATVDLSNQNSAPKAVTPPPTIEFSSSDSRVTISPAGEVCAGQWDTKYLTCSQTFFPVLDSTGKPNANAGKLDLPTGQVTITAYNASHNVSGTTLVTVHPRATSVTLTSPAYQAIGNCISQNSQVLYVATPAFVANATSAESVFAANDYTWVVGDSNVAAVSSYGSVIARNPGVTNVYAKLNGTVSVPLAFATCPPAAIVLASSAFTNGKPLAPFSTTDLTLNNGGQEYLTATPVDANGKALPLLDSNGNLLVTLPLSFITSDTLSGSFTSILPLTSKLTANTSGRFDVIVGCEPPTCNAAVADFVSPAGPTTGKSVGFGYPIYSNVTGVTVAGTTGSTVLVSGTTFAKSIGTTTTALPHLLLAYDSESLALTHSIGLGSVPNSLVVAPNGLKAYLGSDHLLLGNSVRNNGLMVADLTSFLATSQNFPIAGGISTDVITGTVLGVSPDSRYVLVSDTSDPNPLNHQVFLIDTTGTKQAARYTIPNIRAVTFAADNSNIWIAGDAGVYVFNSDTFVKTATNVSTNVKALTWMPDGQSYFAIGDQLTDYSTCDDQKVPSNFPTLSTTVLGGLSTTAIGGVPHVSGLSDLASVKQWFDYSATKTPATAGNVCQGTIAFNNPVPVPSTLQCTAEQISFSPTLEQEFVTGVNPSCTSPEPIIHGFTVGTANATAENTLTANNPIIPLSGGVLKDGRKLYIGTYDGTNALLRRFNLNPALGAVGEEFVQVTGAVMDPTTGLPTTNPPTITTVTTIPATVTLVPSFVAVVPK